MKTLLHVGCSHNRIEQTTRGFNDGSWTEVRLDIDPAVKPDIVGTMTDMSRVATASVDAIFSSHNIEHLYPHEVPVALAEFIRVLSDNSFCVITCPDLKEVCRLVSQDRLLEPAYVSPAGPISPIDILYGHRPALAQGNLYMAHRSGFTEKVLRQTLVRAGFRSIASFTRPGAFDIWVLATKAEMPGDALRQLAVQHFPA